MATVGSASLTNLSVPVSDGSKNATYLQPKLGFRFRVTFINFGTSGSSTAVLTRQIKDFTRPQVSWQEIPIDIYNSKIYVAGKHDWQQCNINIIDDANGLASQLIGQQQQKQLDFAEQSAKASGSDYKFMIRCEVLDGGNGANDVQILETWELYGCWIQSANYNQLAYSSNDALSIALTVRFDNALMTTNGLSAVGVATGIGSTT